MNKRYLHHLWTGIRPIKTWYFIAAFLVSAAVCVIALRHNYQTMTKLRAAVYAADEQNGNVVDALQKLRAYVGSHMNTSLTRDANSVYPPIQLTHTYERLKQAEQDRVNTVNSQVYTDAQHICEAKYPNSFSGGPRVPCIEEYVKTHGTTVKMIPSDLYKFSFASASWSVDVAGISLVFSVLFLALALLRLIAGRVLKDLSR